MATFSSILAWRIPWTEEPGGLQSMGLQIVRLDWSNLALMQARGIRSHVLWGSQGHKPQLLSLQQQLESSLCHATKTWCSQRNKYILKQKMPLSVALRMESWKPFVPRMKRKVWLRYKNQKVKKLEINNVHTTFSAHMGFFRAWWLTSPVIRFKKALLNRRTNKGISAASSAKAYSHCSL